MVVDVLLRSAFGPEPSLTTRRTPVANAPVVCDKPAM